MALAVAVAAACWVAEEAVPVVARLALLGLALVLPLVAVAAQLQLAALAVLLVGFRVPLGRAVPAASTAQAAAAACSVAEEVVRHSKVAEEVVAPVWVRRSRRAAAALPLSMVR